MSEKIRLQIIGEQKMHSTGCERTVSFTEKARKAHPLQRWDGSAALTTSISGLLLRSIGRQL
jgi:hypothetical protein